MIVTSIQELIGKTPLLEIPATVHGLKNIRLYAKLELLNPFGSIKDRIAKAMLAPHRESLRERGATVMENSSGNTAKALQALCSIDGIPFSLVSGLTRVKEQKDILRLMGASIEEVPNASDCFDPNDPNDPQYALERRAAESPNQVFFTSQFTNQENPRAHAETTGHEILSDLPRVDFLIAGVGTAGSSCGTADTLRRSNPDLKLIGLTARRHDFIPGIRSAEELWENGVFRRNAYHQLLAVSSRDAIEGMTTLIRRCGIPAGPSSGANFYGAIQYLRTIDSELTHEHTAVLFACDRMESYISYVKERRPDIFGLEGNERLWHDLCEEEIAEAPLLTVRQLRALLRDTSPLLIDTRSTVAYSLEHIPGALNYPLEDLQRILRTSIPFPRERAIVFVCQHGVFTRPLAAHLSQRGFEAFSLEGGYRAWLNTPESVRSASNE